MKKNILNSNKEKSSPINVRIIFAIIALLMTAPILGAIVLTGFIIYLIITKVGKGETKVEDLRNQLKNKSNENNIKYDDQLLNTDDYRSLTNSQKRLEGLKSLYNNGFMSKDEYYEMRNRIQKENRTL